MSKAIIHISDLHVFQTTTLSKKLNSKDFYINTTDAETLYNYTRNFCNKVIEEFGGYELILVICGDIVDSSEEDEYAIALKLIQKIITDLNIKKENLIIVPGDHDINRLLCTNATREGKKNNLMKEHYEYLEKYTNFSEFYKNLFEIDFPSDKIIINTKILHDEKIAIISINTNYRIGLDGGLGYVPIDIFKEEYQNLKIDPKYSKIAVFHHNIISKYEDKATGQFDKENRVDFLNILKQLEFKIILNGNEHTNSSELKDQIYISDCGSLTTKTPFPSFKIYNLKDENNKQYFENNLFIIQKANKNSEHHYGTWAKQVDLNSLGEEKEFVLKEKPIKIIEDNTLDFVVPSTIEEEEKKEIKHKIEIPISKYGERIFEIIKEKKLFHSGHFHWSETSRAHNWIDTSSLFKDKKDLLLCKQGIVDLIEINNLASKFDMILGLGFEGNMLSTRASVRFNKPFSFLPYSYRYDEHNEYEKKLNCENIGKIASVLIITDVVHDGRTIRKLINKREKMFFDLVKNIYVISLFYSGEILNPNNQILNTEASSPNFDKKNDHLENRIEFYYLKQLKVETCPYRENYKTDCLIVSEGLGCVHNFYDNIEK